MVFKLNYKLFISLYSQIAFEWGGTSLSQHSQFGRNSSMGCLSFMCC